MDMCVDTPLLKMQMNLTKAAGLVGNPARLLKDAAHEISKAIAYAYFAFVNGRCHWYPSGL